MVICVVKPVTTGITTGHFCKGKRQRVFEERIERQEAEINDLKVALDSKD